LSRAVSVTALGGHLWYCGVVVSGEDAPRPYLENPIVLEIETNKQSVSCISGWTERSCP
jgi:hypothetical protein